MYLELNGEIIISHNQLEDATHTFQTDLTPEEITQGGIYQYKVVNEILVPLTQQEKDNHPNVIENQKRNKVEKGFNAVERVVACDYLINHAQWNNLDARIKEIITDEKTSKLQKLANELFP